MNRLKAVYRSWAIPCAGRDVYYTRGIEPSGWQNSGRLPCVVEPNDSMSNWTCCDTRAKSFYRGPNAGRARIAESMAAIAWPPFLGGDPVCNLAPWFSLGPTKFKSLFAGLEVPPFDVPVGVPLVGWFFEHKPGARESRSN